MNTSDFNLAFQNSSIESKIIAALERISMAFRVLLWQESVTNSLSPIQIQVLIFLAFHSSEKSKVSYLAEELNVSKATISDTIKTLKSKQLVFKEVEAHDSRSYIIRLTPEGNLLALKISMFTKELYPPIHALSEQDKENMLIKLLGIIEHLNSTGIISIQRMCKTCHHYTVLRDGQLHYCNLLNQSLSNADLRIDCPEHQLKSA